jgi:hypothetical protein
MALSALSAMMMPPAGSRQPRACSLNLSTQNFSFQTRQFHFPAILLLSSGGLFSFRSKSTPFILWWDNFLSSKNDRIKIVKYFPFSQHCSSTQNYSFQTVRFISLLRKTTFFKLMNFFLFPRKKLFSGSDYFLTMKNYFQILGFISFIRKITLSFFKQIFFRCKNSRFKLRDSFLSSQK